MRVIGSHVGCAMDDILLFLHSTDCTTDWRQTAMADVLVPPEITAEVTQILSNLVLGDNLIRSRSALLSSVSSASLHLSPPSQRRKDSQ